MILHVSRAFSFSVVLGAAFLLWADSSKAPSQQIWEGQSSGFTVEWTTSNLTVRRTTPAAGKSASEAVLDFAKLAEVDWQRTRRGAGSNPIEADTTYRILSLAGPYLSVEEGSYCDCGGAHPSSVTKFMAFDLQHSTPDAPTAAKISDLFPQSSVYGAMVRDTQIQKVLPEASLPKDLPQLLKEIRYKRIQVGECVYMFGRMPEENFAIFDVNGSSASVRVGLSQGEEACRGLTTQIGLELPIPESLRQNLVAAKQKQQGFLMSDSKRISGEAVTRFHFKSPGLSN